MSRFTRIVSVLGAGAMAVALTACGGDDSSDYCDLIESTEDDFSSIGNPTDPENADAVDELSTRFNEIADAAPDDIQGDWQTLADGWQTLSEIDITDPEAAAGLEGLEDMDAATQSITDHVSEECDVDMG